MRTIAIGLLAIALLSACGKKTMEVKPEYKSITETVFASGVLEPDHKYNLTSQSDGYLTELNFTEGTLVKSGDILAVVDNRQNVINEKSATALLGISQVNISENAPALKQTEINIHLAKEKLKQEETQAARYKKLLEQGSVSKLEYENSSLALENAKTNLLSLQQTYQLQKQQAEQQFIAQQAQSGVSTFFNENNQIKAQVGGKVYKKMKEKGDYVRKGDVLAVIGDAEEIYARVNVDESNIARLKTGQKAMVQLNTNKEITYQGTLYEILPAFDEATQSFICKIKFDEQPELKISGTQLQANVIIGSKEKALVIPRSYLDYGNKVYLKKGGEPMIVKTGFVSSEWVEVLEGLTPEDVLVSQIH